MVLTVIMALIVSINADSFFKVNCLGVAYQLHVKHAWNIKYLHSNRFDVTSNANPSISLIFKVQPPSLPPTLKYF